jgi:hypothetical protein
VDLVEGQDLPVVQLSSAVLLHHQQVKDVKEKLLIVTEDAISTNNKLYMKKTFILALALLGTLSLYSQSKRNTLIGIGYLTSNQIVYTLKSESPNYFNTKYNRDSGKYLGDPFYAGISISHDIQFKDLDFMMHGTLYSKDKKHVSYIMSIGRIVRDAWWEEINTWTSEGYFYKETKTYKEVDGDKSDFWGLGLSYSEEIRKDVFIEVSLIGRTSLANFPHKYSRMDIGISIFQRIK